MIAARRRRQRAPLVPWAMILGRDWDQVLQALCMVAFGVWGLLGFTQTSLRPLGAVVLVFDVEFVIVGVLLLVGLRLNSWRLRRRAYMVNSLALVTLAALLVLVSPSPFIALALAFALQGIVMVRILYRQEQMALRIFREAEGVTPEQAWRLARLRF